MRRVPVDMRTLFGCWLSLWCVALGTACGSSNKPGQSGKGAPGPTATRVGSTRGSAVVLSRDERVAVAANRSAGVVTVFALDPDKPLEELIRSATAIDIDGAPSHVPKTSGSEPWAAAIGADDDTAYVISRHDQQVLRINGLHQHPQLDVQTVAVGSEPTAIAISPSGKLLFVANWGEGTISVLTTNPFADKGKIDLNAPLAATGRLGQVSDSIATYSSARPALAHPRALAITDDGDAVDEGETLYATEFFSQHDLEPENPTDLARFDSNRVGLVYPIPITTFAAVGVPIVIAPVTDTSFLDAKGGTTGCFPNQLYAAAADRGRLFVTSMCASPMGPVGPATPAADGTPNARNFQTAVKPSLFVIDTSKNSSLEVQFRFFWHDETDKRRMPLIPNDIAMEGVASPTSTLHRACFTAMGADAVSCVDHDDAGRSSPAQFIDLHAEPFQWGIRPIGLAISSRSAAPFALVVSDGSQTLSVIDLLSNTVRAVEPVTPRDPTAPGYIPHAAETRASPENRGRTFFATGLDLWSFKGQAWNSCESCHPDGLSDGVTWFFTRGPRRTISTAGTYDPTGQRRVMLWGGNIDEVHDVEAIARSVAGGTGAMLQNGYDKPSNDLRILYDSKPVTGGQKSTSTLRNNLNGSLADLVNEAESCDPAAAHCDSTPITDWNDIDAYIRSVRAPRQPTELDGDQVALGKAVFRKARCAGCHGGPDWTLSRVFYTPGPEQNGALPYEKPAVLDPATLGLLRTTSYSVPPEMLALGLNPPAQSGTAPLRRWTQGDVDYAYADPTQLNDQINCVLRAVGTFPVQPNGDSGLPPNMDGIVPNGAPGVQEVRQDPNQEMTALALGGAGFNIPSLIGVAAGAPYFHAGNARTLEEAFDDVFSAHHRAYGDTYAKFSASPDDIRALVAYLLSIDDATNTENVPSTTTGELPFDPDLCPAAPPK